MLSHLVEKRLCWFDGQHDISVLARVKELNSDMLRSLFRALGCVDIDVVLLGVLPRDEAMALTGPAWNRWEKVRAHWFRALLAGEKVDVPRMSCEE